MHVASSCILQEKTRFWDIFPTCSKRTLSLHPFRVVFFHQVFLVRFNNPPILSPCFLLLVLLRLSYLNLAGDTPTSDVLCAMEVYRCITHIYIMKLHFGGIIEMCIIKYVIHTSIYIYICIHVYIYIYLFIYLFI